MSSRPRKAPKRLIRLGAGLTRLSRRFGTAEAGAPLLNGGLLRQCGLQPVLGEGVNNLDLGHADARSRDYDAERAPKESMVEPGPVRSNAWWLSRARGPRR